MNEKAGLKHEQGKRNMSNQGATLNDNNEECVVVIHDKGDPFTNTSTSGKLNKMESMYRSKFKKLLQSTGTNSKNINKPYNVDQQSKELKNHENDEYFAFGEFVACKLRKLSSDYERNVVQYQINSLLFEAALGSFKKKGSTN